MSSEETEWKLLEKRLAASDDFRGGFDFNGGYLTYNGKFVARFKYNRKLKGRFVTFLKNNFSMSEYFTMLEDGLTPVAILETKGFDFRYYRNGGGVI